MYQSVIRSLIVFLLLVWPATIQAAEPAGETRVMVQPSDAVRPYLLFDVDSGQVLAHENAFRRWAPASLTKLMTVYATFRALKLQQIDLNSPVRVSENALLKPPTKMGFPIGTILTVDTAVKILMVKSANDISVALAEAVAGSEPEFIDLMNAHARRLGMTDSHFVNPHGLHEPDQYSTARDFALLASALTLEFPEYADRFKIPALRHGKRRLRNHNALVDRFPGTTGMKTGYVCASGYNVVARAERDGRRLIAVVLGDSSSLTRSIRAAKLLQEGFDGQFDDSRVPLASLKNSNTASPVPADITVEICPKKRRTRPQIAARGKSVAASASAQVTLAEKSAKLGYEEPVEEAGAGQEVKAEGNDPVVDKTEDGIPEDQPPTLKEMEVIYLTARQKVGEVVNIKLGGGVGRNPHGIRHHEGGPAKPVIPVPTRRPAT